MSDVLRWPVACAIVAFSIAGCATQQPNVTPRPTAKPTIQFGRSVVASERWAFSDPKSAQDLEGTPFGEREINEFWVRKGWKLTKREEAYFATIDALQRDGYITKVSRWATCPYNPIYQALVPIDVLGAHVRRGQEFNLDMCDPEGEVKLGSPRFARAKTYEEDHAEGHASDPSR